MRDEMIKVIKVNTNQHYLRMNGDYLYNYIENFQESKNILLDITKVLKVSPLFNEFFEVHLERKLSINLLKAMIPT